MEVNVHHAKTYLSKLIAAAEGGEEVVIARNGKAAVKLVVVGEASRSRRNLLGAGIGKLWVSPEFDSAETSDELAGLFESDENFD